MTENFDDMYNRKFDDQTVLLSTYPSYEDHFVRIDCMTLEQVSIYRDIFANLSKMPGYSIDLVQMENVFAYDIKEFMLSVLPGNQTTYRRLSVKAKDGLKIDWRMNAYEWEAMRCMVQVILDSKELGHQYLGDIEEDMQDDRNDAIVVFAYQERPDKFRTGS